MPIRFGSSPCMAYAMSYTEVPRLPPCVCATPHTLPAFALISASRRMFTRKPSSCAVIVGPNVFAGKLGPPELYQRYFVIPLAPATDTISFTNWLAIHEVSAGLLDGAMLFPIWSQIAPVLRMPA